jgi:hypothetical protein
MTAVGESYAHGNGVQKDRAQALAWLTRSAEAGDRRGMTDLGFLYLDDNPAEAARWFTKASHLGDGEAEFRLGLLYEQGRGVPQSDQMALKLFRSASNSGRPEATEKLRMLSTADVSAKGIQLSGIQPIAILRGPARLYRLLGAGLSLRTVVEVSGAQFVGANVGLNHVQEADSNGNWVKVFIELADSQTSGTVQVTVKEGNARSSISVPIAR